MTRRSASAGALILSLFGCSRDSGTPNAATAAENGAGSPGVGPADTGAATATGPSGAGSPSPATGPSGGPGGTATPSGSDGTDVGGSGGNPTAPVGGDPFLPAGGQVGSPGAATPPGSGGAMGAGGSAVGGELPAPTGGGLGAFVCPDPPYAATPFASDVAAVQVEGVPLVDVAADPDAGVGTDLIILEGPVWLNGTLYLSEINNGPALGGGGVRGGSPPGAELDAGSRDAPPARILALNASGEVSVAFHDVGTNGLGIDLAGSLVGCSHRDGSVQRFGSIGEAPIDLVSDYLGSRFNSPNDLTFGADGTLYFSDPDYQAPAPVPQDQTRAYRVAPGTTTAIPIVEDRPQPNGVTLSPDRQTLYVSASDGIQAYSVQPDGSLGEGTPFAADVLRSTDGMAVDCAGNLYAASNQTLFVVNPEGAELFRLAFPSVQSVTNVAFGGADHKTVYVTSLGTGTRVGLFRLSGEIPGMPY